LFASRVRLDEFGFWFRIIDNLEEYLGDDEGGIWQVCVYWWWRS
jgi:hypothetical protein